MKKIEEINTLVFLVDIRATKLNIKALAGSCGALIVLRARLWTSNRGLLRGLEPLSGPAADWMAALKFQLP